MGIHVLQQLHHAVFGRLQLVVSLNPKQGSNGVLNTPQCQNHSVSNFTHTYARTYTHIKARTSPWLMKEKSWPLMGRASMLATQWTSCGTRESEHTWQVDHR